MPMEMKMKLSPAQLTAMDRIQTDPWTTNINKRTLSSLFKKGAVARNKDGSLRLTVYGKRLREEPMLCQLQRKLSRWFG